MVNQPPAGRFFEKKLRKKLMVSHFCQMPDKSIMLLGVWGLFSKKSPRSYAAFPEDSFFTSFLAGKSFHTGLKTVFLTSLAK